jgi:hypothetical protein
LAQDFFVEKDLFYPVLDNPDGRIQLLWWWQLTATPMIKSKAGTTKAVR